MRWGILFVNLIGDFGISLIFILKWHQNILTPNDIGLTPNLNIDEILKWRVAIMKVEMNDVEYVTETAVTIRGTRRRTTIPKVIVDKFAIKNKDKLRWILFKDGTILITKVDR